MANIKIFFIGVDGEKTVNFNETQAQIKAVKALRCCLQDEGEALSWDAFDNPKEKRTIFQSILKDREMRVDKKILMADRPSFCVITAIDNKAIRLEFYEGHDLLHLEYDIRSKELQSKDLPFFMDEDPQAYDPVKFLKDVFGISEEFSRPFLDKVHKQ